MTDKLTVHMIVRNEEQWIWYAVMSVLPVATKILIYDTESTDNTEKIISTFNDKRIVFKQKGRVNPQQLAELRNEQIKHTPTPWFLLVDGDEVWPKKSLDELLTLIAKSDSQKMGVVVKTRLPVGDLYHYQPEIAGRYELLGKRGHYNMRAYRKSPQYHWKAVPPYVAYVEKYVDMRGVQIQDQKEKLLLLNEEYWHLTHLPRSRTDTHGKRKYEIGKAIKIPLPEVFFQKRPAVIPSPWVHYAWWEMMYAYMKTPLLMLKRNFR